MRVLSLQTSERERDTQKKLKPLNLKKKKKKQDTRSEEKQKHAKQPRRNKKKKGEIRDEKKGYAAHQQARQADLHVKSGRYEEAISCHERAAEYILNVMVNATSDQAKDSLQLQHRHHFRQQDIIRLKMKQVKGEVLKKAEPLPPPPVTTAPTAAGAAANSSDSENIDPAAYYRTMEETDTLIQFLLKRNRSQRSPVKMPLCSPVGPVEGANATNMFKLPKDDKQLIEELQMHNEDLRKHVYNLLKEVESYQEENKALRFKVERLENELSGTQCEKRTPNDFERFVDEALPPLETPDFNFEGLNMRHLCTPPKMDSW